MPAIDPHITRRALLGGSPAEVPERFAQADPVGRAPLPIPVLVVHALDDRTVPAARSREYAARARAAGGDVTLVEVPTGGHRSPIDPAWEPWDATVAWLGAKGAVPAGVR